MFKHIFFFRQQLDTPFHKPPPFFIIFFIVMTLIPSCQQKLHKDTVYFNKDFNQEARQQEYISNQGYSVYYSYKDNGFFILFFIFCISIVNRLLDVSKNN
ncbi:uncharacterized protein RHIMIDRAFT_90389 [Rhizopus microsporus ATCC 52813]|uniref:Uncharacterized protein n=1 Tax=Rhizopus microsporus ATCC 52813 TaxID=1340429 RepID=A0A2G4T3H1_RHIZD|nr:uncharacterized protein RHIMIDRAFT_90389 [Rhizopus microsporus ATCC 52813]PHZ15572.1 hypothetical protein RHIMIDRAFT_90389 [Rhizopus microsporus ATCC 52813]